MSYITQPQQIQAAIERCSMASTLWVDTEVADYKTRNPRLSLIQVLANVQDDNPELVYILDVLEYPDLINFWIEQVMSNPHIEKVFHNAKYDQKFLGKSQVKNITCTLEMAKKIPFYQLPVSNYQLKTLALTLGDFTEIDKQLSQSDWGQRPLTQQQLNYAKMDVIYLKAVHEKLVDLSQNCFPDPTTDNLSNLIKRYQEIQQQWQLLDSEIEHLKQRIKQGMQAQEIQDNDNFKLSTSERKTYTVGLKDLAEFVLQYQPDSEIAITLTQSIQKQLGNNEKLPLQVQKTQITRLIEKPQE
ncbi:MAG: ribonuclease D [Microcoleaceae cyanobacterium]